MTTDGYTVDVDVTRAIDAVIDAGSDIPASIEADDYALMVDASDGEIISADVASDESVDVSIAESIGGGTNNYNDLTNKPQIEGVTLIGNKTYEQLNLIRLTNTEIEELLTH